jgi:hypothetical protein
MAACEHISFCADSRVLSAVLCLRDPFSCCSSLSRHFFFQFALIVHSHKCVSNNGSTYGRSKKYFEKTSLHRVMQPLCGGSAMHAIDRGITRLSMQYACPWVHCNTRTASQGIQRNYPLSQEPFDTGNVEECISYKLTRRNYAFSSTQQEHSQQHSKGPHGHDRHRM